MIIGGYDLESTGLNEPDHRIIEVCVSRYEWTPGAEPVFIDTYEQRINPDRSIDAKALAVHGITPADLVGKPMWAVAGPALAQVLDTCDHVVAHNGFGFDFDFTVREWERIGCPIPDFEPFDTMTVGRWATAWGKSPSLAELCFSCGVDYDPAAAHAAEYDVRVMMECFFYGIRRGVYSLPAS
jgi:DNA polymerase-3 subunit epsilon